MQASLSDTINLGASVVTILGGVATTIGFIRKLTTPAAPSNPHNAFTAPPAPGYPPPTQGYPPAPGYPVRTPGYPPPTQGYPPAPGYPPPAPAQRYQQPPAPGYAPPAQGYPQPVMQRTRRIPHSVVWGFAALGVACVVGYFLVLLFQYIQTGSTSIAIDSPLYVLNIALYAGDLIGSLGATIGLTVSAARARMWGWLTTGVVGLGVVIFTAGILAIVALVPAAFYALFVASRQTPQLPGRLV